MKMELSREVLHYSILRFRRIFLNMFLDRRKALSTDIVLDAARVLESCLFTDSEVHQPFGEGRVALIDRLGDPAAFVGQCDMSLVIYQDQVVDPEILHRDADAGFGKVQFIGNVDGAYSPVSLL